jgi:hypothetical protein
MMSVGNEELLDYVIERDLEDTAARIIIMTVRDIEGPIYGIGKMKLCHFLRGKKPYLFRGHRFEQATKEHWGRLSQFDDDQVLDMIDSLVRLGMLNSHQAPYIHSQIIDTLQRGLEALKHSEAIPMSIPWPLPAKEFPAHQPFHKTKVVE